MRPTVFSVLLLVVALVGGARAASAGPASRSPRGLYAAWSRTHPMTPASVQLLDLAIARSAVVRGLLDEVEQTDVIVLLMYSTEPVGSTTPSFLTFVSAAGASRYVAIRVFGRGEPPCASIPILAHELQHALEVAAAAGVRDAYSFGQLFQQIGWPSGPGAFETDRARATEERVREELCGRLAPSRACRIPRG